MIHSLSKSTTFLDNLIGVEQKCQIHCDITLDTNWYICWDTNDNRVIVLDDADSFYTFSSSEIRSESITIGDIFEGLGYTANQYTRVLEWCDDSEMDIADVLNAPVKTAPIHQILCKPKSIL